MEGFGKRLTGLMEREKLSEARLSKDLGVSPKTINNWKNEKSSPNIIELKKISTRFNESIEYLLYGKDFEKPKDDYSKDILIRDLKEENAALKKVIGIYLKKDTESELMQDGGNSVNANKKISKEN